MVTASEVERKINQLFLKTVGAQKKGCYILIYHPTFISEKSYPINLYSFAITRQPAHPKSCAGRNSGEMKNNEMK